MRLEPNRPFTSDQPAVSIDAGLPPGAHRFKLEVIGTSGARSRPAEVTVVVVSADAGGAARQPLEAEARALRELW